MCHATWITHLPQPPSKRGQLLFYSITNFAVTLLYLSLTGKDHFPGERGYLILLLQQTWRMLGLWYVVILIWPKRKLRYKDVEKNKIK